MNNLLYTFFGPLNKDFCIYFLFLTIIYFSVLVLALIIEIIYIIKNYNKLNLRLFINAILIFSNLFLGYFVNRILFSICNNSLN